MARGRVQIVVGVEKHGARERGKAMGLILIEVMERVWGWGVVAKEVRGIVMVKGVGGEKLWWRRWRWCLGATTMMSKGTGMAERAENDGDGEMLRALGLLMKEQVERVWGWGVVAKEVRGIVMVRGVGTKYGWLATARPLEDMMWWWRWQSGAWGHVTWGTDCAQLLPGSLPMMSALLGCAVSCHSAG
jgi:hypothetical protein